MVCLLKNDAHIYVLGWVACTIYVSLFNTQSKRNRIRIAIFIFEMFSCFGLHCFKFYKYTFYILNTNYFVDNSIFKITHFPFLYLFIFFKSEITKKCVCVNTKFTYVLYNNHLPIQISRQYYRLMNMYNDQIDHHVVYIDLHSPVHNNEHHKLHANHIEDLNVWNYDYHQTNLVTHPKHFELTDVILMYLK